LAKDPHARFPKNNNIIFLRKTAHVAESHRQAFLSLSEQ
jgi:hypothetical protein